MKRLLLLLILAASTIYAQAETLTLNKKTQQVSSYLDQTYKVEPYIKAGLNLATISGVGENYDFNKNNMQVGYYVGAGFTGAVIYDFYWGMELGLSTRGFGGEHEFPEYGQDKNDFEYLYSHNVELVPIFVGYKYKLSDKITLDTHFGMYLSYDYYGEYTYEDNFDSRDSKYYSLSEYANENDMSYKRFDLGIKYGVGVWFNNRVNLGVELKNGFQPMFEVDDTDSVHGYTFNAMATLRYKF
ncbi:MAG: outer membrane beta-barrel protein [Rikenellaceae bacterium]